MRIEHHSDDIAVLHMEAPRANALGKATIVALSKALYDVEQSKAKALVLTGKGRVFSAGLDLVEALAFDRPQLAEYVDQFESLFLQLFAYRLPVVGALNGHALAGGAVMALACDWRIATTSQFTFSLNEVELGLAFPSAAFQVSKHGLPPNRWTEALMFGRRYSKDEALEARIVHAQADDVVAAAVAKAKEICALGAAAVQFTKQDLRYDALVHARARAVESRRRFVEGWLSPEGQQRLRGAVERLKSA